MHELSSNGANDDTLDSLDILRGRRAHKFGQQKAGGASDASRIRLNRHVVTVVADGHAKIDRQAMTQDEAQVLRITNEIPLKQEVGMIPAIRQGLRAVFVLKKRLCKLASCATEGAYVETEAVLIEQLLRDSVLPHGALRLLELHCECLDRILGPCDALHQFLLDIVGDLTLARSLRAAPQQSISFSSARLYKWLNHGHDLGMDLPELLRQANVPYSVEPVVSLIEGLVQSREHNPPLLPSPKAQALPP
mmetsp:Transcript_122249/g.260867  ORF Transcript_122249/g.260867 Transcript_122249/m.260867 type:complete len:249 (-) Transcript_122249:1093-1839(-)